MWKWAFLDFRSQKKTYAEKKTMLWGGPHETKKKCPGLLFLPYRNDSFSSPKICSFFKGFFLPGFQRVPNPKKWDLRFFENRALVTASHSLLAIGHWQLGTGQSTLATRYCPRLSYSRKISLARIFIFYFSCCLVAPMRRCAHRNATREGQLYTGRITWPAIMGELGQRRA
jgi:hypothetical protein